MKTADKCGSRRKQILLSNEYDSNPKRVSPTLAAGAGTVHRRGRATAPAGKGRFAALLSSIPDVKVSSGGEARKEMHAGPNKRSQSEQVGVLEMCSCSSDVEELLKKVVGLWKGGANKWEM
ncbi:uncharacterized protein HKW66_Vig0158060 [Vigna angularis]|uniref:Uncharacterized protein n=1 Tax=Phaseolus angularis TaxID=3914 RepID=A0A8T0JK93_PHAAN|nr:uncharacterized protein HKW66_Vig0158060 [Vigna angularis]